MHAEHPFGFTLTKNYYYFTDWFNKSVIRIPRHQSNANPEEVRHNLRGALEIRSVSADRQPNYFNPCNGFNGGCSHLCLYLGGNKYVCECPNFDSKPCKRELKESTLKPPDDDTTFLPTEGTPPISKPNDSSLMLGIVIVMTLLLLLVVSAIICKFECNF